MDIFYLEPERYFSFIKCNEFAFFLKIVLSIYTVFTHVYIQQVSLGHVERLVKQWITKLSFLHLHVYCKFVYFLFHTLAYLSVMITTNLI